ncbi:MAG TPA: MMPL family transporter [Actinobacteria bacterium]|nr:MMPL family transporter [Actinomycetota bacterium]
MLSRLGRAAAAEPRRFAVAWLIVVALLGATAIAVGPAFLTNITAPDSESTRGLAVLAGEFPGAGGEPATIVFKAAGGVDDPAVRRVVSDFLEEARRVDGVVNLVSPYSPIGAGQISEDRTVAYARLVLAADLTTDEGEAVRDELAALAPSDPGIEVAYGGEVFRERRPPSSETLGLAFAVLVLVFTFGSVLATGLPIATALAGVGTGVLATALLSNGIEMPDFAATIGVMIGLGVGIDYALFIVTRFQEYVAGGRSIPDAVAAALDTSGRAVLFAGVTVVVSLLGMLLMGITFVTGLAVAASTTVLATMVASVTLLPALLGWVGERIATTRRGGLLAAVFLAVALVGVALDLPLLRGAIALALVAAILGRVWSPLAAPVTLSSAVQQERSLSYRWSRFVQRRAAVVTAVGVVALSLVALPILSIQLGFADAGNDPEGTTTRRAYDLLEEGFGPGANGPLLVVATLPGRTDPARLGRLGEALVGVDGVATVSPPLPNDPTAPTAALVEVIPQTSPQSEATTQLVHRLRDEVLPVLAEDTGAQFLVTGPVAANLDFSDYLAARIWWFYGAVLALSFVFLMTVFRSVLVPLKAVGMNLLAIGAAYGIVVAVFQWGWGGALLGITPGPIEPFIPMMMFAIVFGLSMDYEVFLLSRIREEYAVTGDNSTAVADGLAATARVITAAALIMVFVFGSFLLEDTRTVKILGLGLAAAVAIDATVVRMLLVPATMELLGDRNWWIPRRLDAVLPAVAVESAGRAGQDPGVVG